jgi:hypothetical protein
MTAGLTSSATFDRPSKHAIPAAHAAAYQAARSRVASYVRGWGVIDPAVQQRFARRTVIAAARRLARKQLSPTPTRLAQASIAVAQKKMAQWLEGSIHAECLGCPLRRAEQAMHAASLLIRQPEALFQPAAESHRSLLPAPRPRLPGTIQAPFPAQQLVRTSGRRRQWLGRVLQRVTQFCQRLIGLQPAR